MPYIFPKGMCGIFAGIGAGACGGSYEECMKKLKNRGPEGTKMLSIDDNAILGFTRLAINGLTENGMQPMDVDGCSWIVNGEIYNWKALAETNGLTCSSGSDCEVVGALYKALYAGRPLNEIGGLFSSLDGVFAVAIVDTVNQQLIVARDPFGVRPLYVGRVSEDSLFFASEMKSLDGLCTTIAPFPP